ARSRAERRSSSLLASGPAQGAAARQIGRGPRQTGVQLPERRYWPRCSLAPRAPGRAAYHESRREELSVGVGRLVRERASGAPARPCSRSLTRHCSTGTVDQSTPAAVAARAAPSRRPLATLAVAAAWTRASAGPGPPWVDSRRLRIASRR